MTNIEIVFDPKQEAAEKYLHMEEQHEVLPDGEWILAVRRLVKRESLFVYRHAETGNFVLADWVYQDIDGLRVCIELEVMPYPPDLYVEGRPTMENLRFRCCFVDDMVKNLHDKMKRMRYEEKAARDEGIEEKGDAIQRLKNMGLFEAADRMERGIDKYTPEAMGGESFQELKDDISSMARSSSRIITHG
tara:strand:- start:811 stop:1380 length:570 start_codon:yes stop_codon:yes gene_type:complete